MEVPPVTQILCVLFILLIAVGIYAALHVTQHEIVLWEQQEQRDAFCQIFCRQFMYEGSVPEGCSQISDLLAVRPGTCFCFNTLRVKE